MTGPSSACRRQLRLDRRGHPRRPVGLQQSREGHGLDSADQWRRGPHHLIRAHAAGDARPDSLDQYDHGGHLGATQAFQPTGPGTMRRSARPVSQKLLLGRLLWRVVFVSSLMSLALSGSSLGQSSAVCRSKGAHDGGQHTCSHGNFLSFQHTLCSWYLCHIARRPRHPCRAHWCCECRHRSLRPPVCWQVQ